MVNTPRFGQPYIATTQFQKEAAHSEGLNLNEIITQTAVIDRDQTSPPGSPNNGDLYLIPGGSSGDWSGQTDNVTGWYDGWVIVQAFEGWRLWVNDENIALTYDGSTWNTDSSTVTELDNLSDAALTTPFAQTTGDILLNINNNYYPQTRVNWVIEDKDLTAPPGGESDGDTYIVASVATGAWAGQEDNIAVILSSTWYFIAAEEGLEVWAKDENKKYIFDSSSWVEFTGGGGGSAIEVEDEGSPLTTAVTKFNFVGPGVTATEPIADEITVTVPGGDITGGLQLPMYYLRDEKADNTDGGGSTAVVWNTRTLNTEVNTEISGSSLTSDQFDLPAGVYYLEGAAPGYRVGVHKLRIRNITDSTNELIGDSCDSSSGTGGDITHAFVHGKFTISATKTFELQHYTKLGKASDGFGRATSVESLVTGFEEDPVIEIYSEVRIWQISQVGNVRGALVYDASTQAITASTPVDVAWDTEEYDTNGLHDNSTNNERMTVPGGVTKIRLHANIEWDTATDGWRSITFSKNGALTYNGRAYSKISAAGDTVRHNITSPVLEVASGDYFTVEVDHNSATTPLDIVGGNTGWFMMEIIEPAILPDLSGAQSYVELNDTESSLTADGSKLLRINDAGTAIEHVQIGWREPVRAATVGPHNLSGEFENGDAIDGVTLATDDRILIKNQASAIENGIYTVNTSGTPTRAKDFDEDSEVFRGIAVIVEEGTVNAAKLFQVTAANPIEVGVDNITWVGLTIAASDTTFAAIRTIDATDVQNAIDEVEGMISQDRTEVVTGNIVLSKSQFTDNLFFDLGGTPAGAFNYDVSNGDLHLFVVRNATGRVATIRVDGAGGVTQALADGITGIYYSDGTDIIEVADLAAGGGSGVGYTTASLQTTDATQAPILAIAMASGEATTIRGIGHGREDATGDVLHFEILCGGRNQGGTSTHQGERATAFGDAGTTTWLVESDADDTGDTLRILVQGEAAHTVDWEIKYITVVQ